LKKSILQETKITVKSKFFINNFMQNTASVLSVVAVAFQSVFSLENVLK
jgi:hypothetical protein